MDLKTLELKGEKFLSSNECKYIEKENYDQEQIRLRFVNEQFSLNKIKNMTLDNYIIGKGFKNSFCYLIEYAMACLGDIGGSTAGGKYGIYFSKERKDYVTPKAKYGTSIDEAFNNIKHEIINIINAGFNDDYSIIENSILVPLFRRKIFYVYHPDKSIPIYNEEHLNLFLKELGIPYCEEENYYDKMFKLMHYKNSSLLFRSFSNLLFMRFLYSGYAFREQIALLKGNLIVNDIEVTTIENPHLVNKLVKKVEPKDDEKDYEQIQKIKNELGKNAEEFVLAYEKKKNPKYKNKIKLVSNKPSYGFDIISYDEKGNEKHIEVKSSSNRKINPIKFYITNHEYETMQSDSKYYIYYVSWLKNKKATLIKLNKDDLKSIIFHPVVYKVIATIKDKETSE